MKTETPDIFTGLLFGDQLRRGVADLMEGKTTTQSCLAAIASLRLCEAGFLPEVVRLGDIDSEHTFYRLLGKIHYDPCPSYNSRIRELVSFEFALAHRLRWEASLPS